LRVNQQYIASAGTADKYRVEPPFKLQGSYRNMNKMSEKVVSAMNDKEIETMIMDHYMGEAQTLTQGTEENLLKLKEILGYLTETEKARYEDIKKDFMRNKISGDSDMDGMSKITQQLVVMNDMMKDNAISKAQETTDVTKFSIIMEQFSQLHEQLVLLIPSKEKDLATTELLGNVSHYIGLLGKRREELKKKEGQ